MRGGSVTVSLLLVALLGLRARAELAPAPAGFDYLYVHAHEGNASGGHAAIRFGDDSFDFQNRDGWVVPRREDWRRLQHVYRTLQNRSIELSRIEASPETVALLRSTFERRVLAESRQFELEGELGRDVALLEALAAHEAARVPVRGAGFFADAQLPGAVAPAVLSELRTRIAARHGDGWLAGRRDAALRALNEAITTPLEIAGLRADPLAYPVAHDSVSRRSGQSLAALAACDVILRPRPLRDGVRAGEAVAPDAWFTLDAAMRARLLELRATWLDAAVALAASRRPDWGEALLLAGARLVALDESLAVGHLVVLDAFPSDAQTLRVGRVRRALLPTLLDNARSDFVEAHQLVLEGDGFREASWSQLEGAVTRISELRSVEAGASRLRVTPGSLLPEGRVLLPVPPPADAAPDAIARAADAARDALRAYRRALESEYRYNLFTRNCVSELFRTIEAALAGEAGAPPAADRESIHAFVKAESERRLGGYVDPLASANFIPFVSSHNVRAGWRVAEAVHLPSAREHAEAAEGGGLAGALRESNVLTSSFYRPAEDAGFFLFFTDGSWAPRPLLGAANLVAALARSSVGVLQLPFDRGRGLRAGLSGALWSAPELFFVNIRKGTSEYVSPELRPPPG